jgi:hypothetical protein
MGTENVRCVELACEALLAAIAITATRRVKTGRATKP